MKVIFGEQAGTSRIFQDMLTPQRREVPSCNKQGKADTFEPQNLKEKIKKNKKYLILGALAGAAIIGAIVIKKNLSPLFKGAVQTAENGVKNLEPTPQTITGKMIENAKTFLINDVKTTGEASVNGVCIYGPDSIGKEEAIKGLLGSLQDAGYKIEHAPRAKEKPLKDISSAIVDLIQQAEERFTKTKQRTAIVVRDLDQIASDRNLSGGKTSCVISSLIKMQDCRKRGFTWISEAVDMTKADNAVTRMGRMEHQIVAIPSIKDDKAVWNKYIELIEKFKDSPKRDNLLAEAKEILSRKGI